MLLLTFPGAYDLDPELHPRPRRAVRGGLRRGGRRLGVDVGHAQERRSRAARAGCATCCRRSWASRSSWPSGSSITFADRRGGRRRSARRSPGISIDGLSNAARDRRAARDVRSAAGSSSARRRRIGFAVATLARSQLAGIGVGIALYFGEAFASIFLPDIVKYLPFAARDRGGRWRRRLRGGRSSPNALSPDLALAPPRRLAASGRWSSPRLHGARRDHRLTPARPPPRSPGTPREARRRATPPRRCWR